MADRAYSPNDPEKGVFELDKDERWHARLAEARARREIALKERASGGGPVKRPKPWEVEGYAEPNIVEAEYDPAEDDSLDFSERVKSLRKTLDAFGSNSAPVDNNPKPPAEPDVRDAFTPPPSEGSIADRYIEALAPDFKPVRPYVPDVGPDETVFRAPAAPALLPQSKQTNTGAAAVPAAPTSGAQAGGKAIEPSALTRTPRNKGVPALLLAGICALAVVPFTKTVGPIEKGPAVPQDVFGFVFEPALGVMRPMNVFPRRTRPYEWIPEPNLASDGPIGVEPQFVAALQQNITPFSDSVSTPGAAVSPIGALDLAKPFAAPALPTAVAPLVIPLEDRQPSRIAPLPLVGVSEFVTPETRQIVGEGASDALVVLPKKAALVSLPTASDIVPAPNVDAGVTASPEAPSAVIRPVAKPIDPEATVSRDTVSSKAAALATPPSQEEAAQQPATSASVLRVTVLVPGTTDPALADQIGADVTGRGHLLATIKPVDLKISTSNVRYFHAGDREGAARLADAYGATLRDFTAFRPSPSDGTVEIWLKGDSERRVQTHSEHQASPRAQAPAVETPQPRVVIVRRQPSFFQRLTNALGGGHRGDGKPDPSNSDSGSSGGTVAATAPTPTASTAATVGKTGGNGGTGGSGGSTSATAGTTTGSTGSTTGGTTSGTGGGTGTGGTGTTSGGTGGTTSGGTGGATSGGGGTTTGSAGGTTSGTGTSPGGTTGSTSGGTSGSTSGSGGTTSGGTSGSISGSGGSTSGGTGGSTSSRGGSTSGTTGGGSSSGTSGSTSGGSTSSSSGSSSGSSGGGNSGGSNSGG